MLPETLDLRKLKAFQLTAKHGGLRVAAARLRLSVPAVSFQIKRLEKELGVELFQRLPHGLVLTRAGEDFLREAAAIFDRVEGALAALAPGGGFSGQLSISTAGDIVWYFTPKISSFIKRYPDIQLRHHVYNSVHTLRMVEAGQVDVGIGYFPKLPPALTKEVVTESTLSLVCSQGHPLLRRLPFRLDDLVRHKLVLPPNQSSTRKIIDQVFAKAEVKTRSVIETGSCQTARDFAENGVGVAMVHSLCVAQKPSTGLRYIDISAQFGKVDFAVVYRKESAHSPLLRGFLDQLTIHEGL